MLLELLLWIVFGALVGWVASLIMGTNDDQGGIANIVVGILGALLGGFIARQLWGGGVTGFNFTSFLIALGGAILLVGIVRMFRRGM